jgi:putative peptidoglycan lipid II flippase
VILMWPMGPAGLTLANTVSSTLNVALLIFYLRKKIGPLGGKKVLNSVLRVSAASLCAGAAAFPFTRLALWTQTGHSLQKALHLGLAGLCGMAAFFLAGRCCGSPSFRCSSSACTARSDRSPRPGEIRYRYRR